MTIWWGTSICYATFIGDKATEQTIRCYVSLAISTAALKFHFEPTKIPPWRIRRPSGMWLPLIHYDRVLKKFWNEILFWGRSEIQKYVLEASQMICALWPILKPTWVGPCILSQPYGNFYTDPRVTVGPSILSQPRLLFKQPHVSH